MSWSWAHQLYSLIQALALSGLYDRLDQIISLMHAYIHSFTHSFMLKDNTLHKTQVLLSDTWVHFLGVP